MKRHTSEREVKKLKKAITEILMTLFLISISFGLIPVITQASPIITTFYVDPPSIIDLSLTPGSTFTVNVNVSDAEDLYGWQVQMRWDGTVLDAIDIVFGDFLAGQPEGTERYQSIGGHVTSSYALMCNETTIGDYSGVNGNGWLFSVTFRVRMSGETAVRIDGKATYWIDSTGEKHGDDPGEMNKGNGYFDNRGGTIPATIEIYPDWLDLDRKSGFYQKPFIWAYIELPAGYDVNNIDISTIRLNLEAPAKLHPTHIGDDDEDGVPDLYIRFDRKDVEPLLWPGIWENILTITGLVNGEMFEGSDTMTVP